MSVFLGYPTEKIISEIHKRHDDADDRLRFIAVEDNAKISFQNAAGSFVYSFTGNNDYQKYDLGREFTLSKGQKLYLRAEEYNENLWNGSIKPKFKIQDGKIAAKGSIQYLLKKDGKIDSVPAACFGACFQKCYSLISAPTLPAKILNEEAYVAIFEECTNLTRAPILPATTLNEACYAYMFNQCLSLKISENNPNNGYLIFDYSEDKGIYNFDCMFEGTSGTYQDNPYPGNKYYCYT